MTRFAFDYPQGITADEKDALWAAENLFGMAEQHLFHFTRAAELCVFVEGQRKALDEQQPARPDGLRTDIEAARKYMAARATARGEQRGLDSWMTLAIDGGILHAYHFRCAIEAISVRYRRELASFHAKVSPDLIEGVLHQFDQAFPHAKELRNAVGHIVDLSATDDQMERNSIDRESRIYMQQSWSPPFGVTYYKAPGLTHKPVVEMPMSVSPATAAQIQSVLNQLRIVLLPLTNRL